MDYLRKPQWASVSLSRPNPAGTYQTQGVGSCQPTTVSFACGRNFTEDGHRSTVLRADGCSYLNGLVSKSYTYNGFGDPIP